jgi:hypothetical protein
MRAGKTGPKAEDELALGSPRSLRRDAPDSIWFAIPCPTAEERRDLAHPRWYDERRTGGVSYRGQSWGYCGLHEPQ